jgi:hypothetical protein
VAECENVADGHRNHSHQNNGHTENEGSEDKVKKDVSAGWWAAIVVVLVFLLWLIVIPVTAQDQRPRSPQIFGAQANAWSAATVGIAGTSNVVDTAYTPFCSAFGNTSNASTITVQLSADGSTFYSSATNTGAVTGNFGLSFSPGARYVRLISSAASTITATLQCKT